jgi:hypothetical protein
MQRLIHDMGFNPTDRPVLPDHIPVRPGPGPAVVALFQACFLSGSSPVPALYLAPPDFSFKQDRNSKESIIVPLIFLAWAVAQRSFTVTTR